MPAGVVGTLFDVLGCAGLTLVLAYSFRRLRRRRHQSARRLDRPALPPHLVATRADGDVPQRPSVHDLRRPCTSP